ncbi:hypothetical protein IID23_01355 [Patescibacteria group bacterium]|nr:hypothetical protein [Patescibacteria group bacterium]
MIKFAPKPILFQEFSVAKGGIMEATTISDDRLIELMTSGKQILKPWGRGSRSLAIIYLHEVRRASYKEINALIEASGQLRMKSTNIKSILDGGIAAIKAEGPIDPKVYDPIIVEIAKSVNGEFVKHDEPKHKTLWSSSANSPTLPIICPRCRGRMRPEVDKYGTYATCFTCGYVHESNLTPAQQEVKQDQEEKNRGERERSRKPTHGRGKRKIYL